jgi:hypothetical protein
MVTANLQRGSRRTTEGVERGYSRAKGVRCCGCRIPSFAAAAAAQRRWNSVRAAGAPRLAE